MPEHNYNARPYVDIMVADGPNLKLNVDTFEWKSFLNGGYIIRAKLIDSYMGDLQHLMRDKILPKARSQATPVKFRMAWSDDFRTEYRKAYITDIRVLGDYRNARVELVATDPPSWRLNAGRADGKVYTGKISRVIKQVVSDYQEDDNIQVEVTETNDSDTNKWWMMRMPPKLFIMSLLDWSASVTDKKTTWAIASVAGDDGTKLIIKQQHELQGRDFGEYIVSGKADDPVQTAATMIKHFELLSNNFMSVMQSKLVTSGISSVSGQYIDKVINKDHAVIDDGNTENKINVDIKADRGYTKPSQEWATHIMSIPELSGGALGIKYENYIDGHARGIFIDMLNMVMRMKITVLGDHRLHDSSQLGASTLTISAFDTNYDPYFLNGKWMVYGFHHKYSISNGWSSDIYIYRLDWNAEATKV